MSGTVQKDAKGKVILTNQFMEARESMLGLHGTFLGTLRGSLFIIFFPKKHQRLLKTKYYHHLAQTTHLSLSTHEIIEEILMVAPLF